MRPIQFDHIACIWHAGRGDHAAGESVPRYWPRWMRCSLPVLWPNLVSMMLQEAMCKVTDRDCAKIGEGKEDDTSGCTTSGLYLLTGSRWKWYSVWGYFWGWKNSVGLRFLLCTRLIEASDPSAFSCAWIRGVVAEEVGHYSWSSSRSAKVHTSQMYGILELNRVASAPNRFATMLPASGARNHNFVCLAFSPWRQSASLNTCRNDDNSTEHHHGTETGRDRRRREISIQRGIFAAGIWVHDASTEYNGCP